MIAMKDTKRACIAGQYQRPIRWNAPAGRLANDYQANRAKVTMQLSGPASGERALRRDLATLAI
jgi:hypothetical protein